MDRWMKKSLPNHFFTKHLKTLGWKIDGATDIMGIKDVKEISLVRLKEVIEGIENGTVTFVDESFQPLDE
jgi:hypothetical protein